MDERNQYLYTVFTIINFCLAFAFFYMNTEALGDLRFIVSFGAASIVIAIYRHDVNSYVRRRTKRD